jgi:hypothetical protein
MPRERLGREQAPQPSDSRWHSRASPGS